MVNVNLISTKSHRKMASGREGNRGWGADLEILGRTGCGPPQ